MGFVHLGIKKNIIDMPMQNTTFKWIKAKNFYLRYIFIIKNHHGTIALSILHACSH